MTMRLSQAGNLLSEVEPPAGKDEAAAELRQLEDEPSGNDQGLGSSLEARTPRGGVRHIMWADEEDEEAPADEDDCSGNEGGLLGFRLREAAAPLAADPAPSKAAADPAPSKAAAAASTAAAPCGGSRPASRATSRPSSGNSVTSGLPSGTRSRTGSFVVPSGGVLSDDCTILAPRALSMSSGGGAAGCGGSTVAAARQQLLQEMAAKGALPSPKRPAAASSGGGSSGLMHASSSAGSLLHSAGSRGLRGSSSVGSNLAGLGPAPSGKLGSTQPKSEAGLPAADSRQPRTGSRSDAA
jgi:hypothetical protein